MPEITLTSFVDFVLANGTSRITRVREIKRQFEAEYEPVRDFYKDMREAIQEHHKGNPKAIEEAVRFANERQRAHYAAIAKSYGALLRKNSLEAPFDAPIAKWTYGDLSVAVNPEIGFRLAGKPTAVKLYFKTRSMSQERASVILHLMKGTVGTSNLDVALLDVRRARVFPHKATTQNLDALLAGEARALSEMWKLVAAS